MDPLWLVPVIVLAVVGSVFLVLAMIRLSKAIKEVRGSLEELAQAMPRAQRSAAEMRAAVDRTRRR